MVFDDTKRSTEHPNKNLKRRIRMKAVCQIKQIVLVTIALAALTIAFMAPVPPRAH